MIEYEIEQSIVGIPMDSHTAQDMQNRIKQFVSLLETKIEITYIDEDFSSFEAKKMMKGKEK